MNKISILLLPIILLAVPGCVTLGPQFSSLKESNPSKALVYIYRGDELWGSRNVTPTILANDSPVAKLAYNGFIPIYLTPGKYTIKTKWGGGTSISDAHISETFEGGKTYFYQFTLHEKGSDMGFFGGNVYTYHNIVSSFVRHEKDEAVQGLSKCQLIPKI